MVVVLMLVFKDLIFGLVVGIQFFVNDMLKLGDWLEMLKYGVDGVVIDIGLIIVKVRNWDNIIIIIFIWFLVFDFFKNWSGMLVFGG